MKIGDEIAGRVAFGKSLEELGEKYPDLVVLDSDVCASTQTQYFRDKYPKRFYQIGIAEATMIGVASGLATIGFLPFVSAFAIFLAKRAIDQIRVSIAYANLNVKLNGGYGGLPTGQAGATHSSVEDIAIMRAMPNMKVFEPADPMETKKATELVIQTPGPAYLRTVRCPVPVIFDENHKPEFGKSIIINDGKDVAIISSGMMTPKALSASEKLKKQGIYSRVIHMGSIKPIDRDAIVKAAQEIGTIITVENHGIYGGLGGAVAEIVCEESPCKVKRLGFRDLFPESGNDEYLFSKYNMNTENIEAAVKKELGL